MATPEPNTGCWLWSGKTFEDGYGRLHARSIGESRAHRASYHLYRGEIPDGMLVCHTCDTPSCINPDHLFLGAPLDNTADMMAKGRHHHKKKTACPSGHPYDVENTYVTSTGSRLCRECNRTCSAMRKKRLKACS